MKRKTPKERKVDFQNTSMLNQSTLNLDSNQMLYLVQEASDFSESAMTVDEDDKFDSKNKVIKNVADPANTKDAVNKQYADTIIQQVQTNASAAFNFRK
ncbi:MAG: hypothetical protein KAX49_13905 [Halanaerobiales bacterium]|nr:hypothetical protein [Halanaerobiales bacterium]